MGREIKRLLGKIVDMCIVAGVSMPHLNREMRVMAVKRVLEASGGNKSMAARRLGVSRRQIYWYLEKYGSVE